MKNSLSFLDGEWKHNLDSITTFRASAMGPPSLWAKAADLHVAISKSLATKPLEMEFKTANSSSNYQIIFVRLPKMPGLAYLFFLTHPVPGAFEQC